MCEIQKEIFVHVAFYTNINIKMRNVNNATIRQKYSQTKLL